MVTRSHRWWRSFSVVMTLLLAFLPVFPASALGKATRTVENPQPVGSFSVPVGDDWAASSSIPAEVPPLPGEPQPAKPDLGE